MTDLCDRNIFIEAVMSNDVEACRRLFSDIADSANPDKKALLWSALMSAVYEGHKAIVDMLLTTSDSGGAYMCIVNDRSESGWTALMASSFWGYLDIAELLISKGANLNHRDFEGNTALIWAAIRGNLKVIQLLISHGADIDIRSNSGSHASIEATRHGHCGVSDWLRKWPFTMAVAVFLDLDVYKYLDFETLVDIVTYTNL